MIDSKDKPVTITIEGLELFAHHGLLPEERRVGQLFGFDIALTLATCPACESDDIGDTVNYAEVADCVSAVSSSRDYNLLETLAAAVADAIVDRFPPVRQVSVRAVKKSPPMPHSVNAVAVTVQRRRSDSGL